MDILGLPLHPLVVHLVVVALPLGALATLAAVVSRPFRTRYGLLSLGTLTVGALASVVAKLTGESLAETVTLPERHAALGNATVLTGLGAALLAWLWWLLERRQEKAPVGTASFGAMLAGGLVAAAALAVAVLTVLTGHAGAQATWSMRLPAPAASAMAGATYTLSDVAAHASAESCWAAIHGGVYDLTRWVEVHPGGGAQILALCGTDASARFDLQHGTRPRPNAQLAGLKIGELG